MLSGDAFQGSLKRITPPKVFTGVEFLKMNYLHQVKMAIIYRQVCFLMLLLTL